MIDGLTLRIIFAVIASQILLSSWFFQSKNPDLNGIKTYTKFALCFFLMFTVLSFFAVKLQLIGSFISNILFVLSYFFFTRAFIELLDIRTSQTHEKLWLYFSLISISLLTAFDITPSIRVPVGEIIIALPPLLYLTYLIRYKLRTFNQPREINFTKYSVFVVFFAHIIYLNAFTFSSSIPDLLNNQIKNIAYMIFIFGHLSLTIAFLMLVSGLKQTQLIALSNIDSLTGTLNRRAFFEQLEEILQADNDKYFIMLDVDYFKKVNDEYGHLAGDEVLRHIANKLKQSVSKNDLLSRYGGEEFIILVASCGDNDIQSIGERIRTNIETTNVVFNGHSIPITISVGIAKYTEDNYIDDIDRADHMLYKAKERGRNQVCL